MGLNFVFVMQTPRICGIGCLPATSRSSSMHYRAKNSTSAPTLCRCFASRWLSRSIVIIGLLASARSQWRELDGERYIHRMNCEFAGYADHILQEKGVTCTPTYWSERDDWTLAMVAAGLGFAFMPENAAKHPGVVALPVVEPEFWRNVNLVTVRGRPYSPGVGALVREAMRKKWFGSKAIAARLAEKGWPVGQNRPALPAERDDFCLNCHPAHPPV